MSRYACYITSILGASCLMILLCGGLMYYGLEIKKDAGDITNLPLFQMRNCSITNATVVLMSKCYFEDSTKGRKYSSRYVSVWKDGSSQNSIVINPLSAQKTMSEAEDQMTRYSFNTTYPCMCNMRHTSSFPVVTNFHQCSVWDACILDVSYVQNLQNDEHDDYKKGDVMFIVGVTMSCVFCVSIVIFVIFLCRKRCYCCTRRQNTNFSYTILSPKSLKKEKEKECNHQRDIYYRSYRENIVNNPTYFNKWVTVVNGLLIGPFPSKEDAEEYALQTYVFGGYVTLVGQEAIVDTFQLDDFYT